MDEKKLLYLVLGVSALNLLAALLIVYMIAAGNTASPPANIHLPF